MATIENRIDNVTEDVTLGKKEIATAINSKNANGVNVSETDTFSSMASAVNNLNIEKVTPPTVDWDSSTKKLTLSNSIKEATNLYKQNTDTSWNTYTSPVTLNTLGKYDFMAYRDGSIDSNIISQELTSLMRMAFIQDVTYSNGWEAYMLPDTTIGDGDYLGEVWMNGYTGNSICLTIIFKVGIESTWQGDVEYLKLDRVEYNGDNDNMKAWLRTTGAFQVNNPSSSLSVLSINPKGFRVVDAETFTLVFSDSSGNEITATFNIEWTN